MKRSKRILALLLTVLLLGNTVLGAIPAPVTAAPVDDPNLIMYEDFNDIYALIDKGEATLTEVPLDSAGTKWDDDPTVADEGNFWNGANSSDWFMYCNNPKAIIQPSKDGGIDGSGCVVIKQNGGRASVCYQIPKDVYDTMVAGEDYTVTAYVKAVGASQSPSLEIHNNASVSTRPFVEEGKWTKIEYTFTLSKGVGRDYVRIFLGQGAAGGGTFYYDNVTIKKTYKATRLDMDITESYLEVGKSLQLNPKPFPTDVITDITYSSSAESVATVDKNGLITGVKAGTAVITATAVNGDVKATCTVQVVDQYVSATSIAINKTSLNVNPGHMEKLAVTFDPENTTDKRFTWSTSDASVVSVDTEGNIIAQKKGSATITATAGSKTATCAVTVADAAGFLSTDKAVAVDFGHGTTVDLSKILTGEYTVLTQPTKGMIELSGSNLAYTAYTWLMEKDGEGFTDAVYNDEVKIAVKNTDGKTALITLKITINKLEELFYDESGNWISNVDLMFSQEHLDAIKLEAKNDPDGLRAQLIQNALKTADSYLYNIPYVYISGSNEDGEEVATGDITMHFLMAYLLTKDVKGQEEINAKYLEKTIQWVSASLGYPYWGTTNQSHRNSDRAAGHQLMSTAMVYYWLKDELKSVTCTDKMGDEKADGSLGTVTVTENMPILDALEKRLWYVSSQMYDHSLNYDYYVMNHLHIRFSGLLVAATALRADAKTDAEKQNLIKWTGISLYKNGWGMYASMPDGTNQEGLDYWAYGTDWLLKTPIIAQQVYGIDMYAMTNLYKDSPEFVLYMMLSQDVWENRTNIVNMGDTYGSLSKGISQLLRVIAAQYGDATAQWMAQRFEEEGVDAQNTATWMSAVYADTDLEAVSPIDGDLETLKWFKDLDLVVSHSDWSGNEDILIMKTGVPCGKNLMDMVLSGEYAGNPDAGHAHPDANHITLFANGEYLLRDEGYSKPKLTSNHNTLLVDGKGQLGEGEDWMQEGAYIDSNSVPSMKVVEANETYGYDYIVGDATQAYDSALGLSKYERNIVYLKEEQVMLVVDNIKAQKYTDFELRWFPASKTAAKVGNMYQILSKNNTMNFYPFTEKVGTYFTDMAVTTNSGNILEKGFMQRLSGWSWQNAVAFSWDAIGGEAAKVRYLKGEDNIHQFEVNGKIYTVNVETNEVSVAAGKLDVADNSDATDSRISTVQVNGVVYDAFKADTTTYTLARWWKTAEVDIKAFPVVEGAKVTVEYDKLNPTVVTITGESRDGSSKTVYTIHVTNENNILGIAGIESSVEREGYIIDYIYDGYISGTIREPDKFWVSQNLPAITFDMGKLVEVQKVDIAFHLSYLRDTYFDLLVSLDGENWTKLVDDGVAPQTPGTSDPNHSEWVTVLEGASAQARYVRVQHRGQSQTGKDEPAAFNGIQEITIMGKEVAEVTPDPTEPSTGPADPGADGGTDPMLIALFAVLGVAAAAVGGFVLYRNSKKKKMENE